MKSKYSTGMEEGRKEKSKDSAEKIYVHATKNITLVSLRSQAIIVK